VIIGIFAAISLVILFRLKPRFIQEQKFEPVSS
jgi:hypothetical protein